MDKVLTWCNQVRFSYFEIVCFAWFTFAVFAGHYLLALVFFALGMLAQLYNSEHKKKENCD